MAELRGEKNRKSFGAKSLLWLLLALVIVLAASLIFLRSGSISVGGQTLDKGALRVELYGSDIEDVAPLLKLEGPEYMDLRGCPISAEDYLRLKEAFTGCEIHWDVPLGAGGERYYNFSKSIEVPSFSRENAENYALMPNLEEIDLRGEQLSPEDYYLLAEIVPDCRIIWSVPICGNGYDSTITAFTVGDIKDEEVELFRCFENLKTLNCSGSTYSQYREIERMLPHCELIWSANIGGISYDCRLESLSLPQGTAAEEIISASPNFKALGELDLRECTFSSKELLSVKEALPETRILAETEIYGLRVSTDAQELDFSGIEIEDTSELESLLPLFHNLKKVIMCDCGISDADMDALNRRHSDIQFVWMLRFSLYNVRTDAKAFCASNVPGFVAPRLGDEELYPIRYLTELEALDLGHMPFSDLSFLENMPKLRYLIMVENRISDISPIAGLENLYYLELFNNRIDDISPLLNCENLKHLNIGYTRGYDIAPLAEMSRLERLWCSGGVLSDAQRSELEAALPETEIYSPLWDGDGSTGGGWREHESYYEMRDALAMHYMPGGTGVPGKE